MGLLLGLMFTNIPPHQWPRFYHRFVDDALAIFTKQVESEEFLALLNGVHLSLRFTVEGRATTKYHLWMYNWNITMDN